MADGGQFKGSYVGASMSLAKRASQKASRAMAARVSDFADSAADYARAVDNGGGLRLQHNERAGGERLTLTEP